MNLTAKESIQKIPLALEHIQVPKGIRPLVHNYIINLILTVTKDPEFQKSLTTKTTEELIKEFF